MGIQEVRVRCLRGDAPTQSAKTNGFAKSLSTKPSPGLDLFYVPAPGMAHRLGANLWVSMMGELWKVAREQCRPTTTDKKTERRIQERPSPHGLQGHDGGGVPPEEERPAERPSGEDPATERRRAQLESQQTTPSSTSRSTWMRMIPRKDKKKGKFPKEESQ